MKKFNEKEVLAKLEHFEEEISRLRAEREASASADPDFCPGIKFPVVAEIFTDIYKDVRAGFVDLRIKESSKVWNSMFGERNIVYFRATSLVSPSIWENPYMAAYDNQQRLNIEYIDTLSDEERKEYDQIIKQVFDVWGLTWLGDTNFERVFAITNEQLADQNSLVDIIYIICQQSEYIDLRVCYEGDLAVIDRRDFGLAIPRAAPEDAEMLFYELDTMHNSLHGVRIVSNRGYTREAADRYRTFQTVSEPVHRKSDFETVVRLVSRVCKRSLNLDVLREIWNHRRTETAHKCLTCFLDSESQVRTGKWIDAPQAKKAWFEMFVAENKAVEDYVRIHKPKRIIEVGCGPGRLIHLLSGFGFDNFEEIVGIDCDSQMHDAAHKRFKAYAPKIRILKMEVKDFLPYEDDRFDFCINAMNIVGWQENEVEWLKEMLRCSKCAFFTVYKRGNEDLRIQMYREREHVVSDYGVHKNAEGQIVLGDCSTMPKVKSKAYSEEEVVALCETVSTIYDCQYRVDKEANGLLYLCFLDKTVPANRQR